MAMESGHDIAIVGVGCRFPGADDLEEFWRVLSQGEDHVIEVPPDRWNLEAFYDPNGDAPGKTYVRRAGFVKGHDEFDNRVFNISDLEASSMDPQQRFVLECSFLALENAGIPRHQVAGSNTGVYMGVMNTDYTAAYGLQSPTTNYTLTGASPSNVAARVSYVLDLRGNALVVNTACSSSLEAIHLACQALRAGDVDTALAGGVNSLLDPGVFIQLSRARMASPSGRSQAFSATADGYARGEGCGVLVLKRLSDARRDGDRIWATIHTGANQDGHDVTPMTAPSWLQQKVLFNKVIKGTGIPLDCIEYIEAHGTGTKAGDPVEVRSLGEFFLENGSVRRRMVGSVKTNIGHLESAAGVAGVIKVLLMMRHGKFVPSLHFTKPNPRIDFDLYKLVVCTGVADWTTPDKIACVNSFSFGGTNSHAILKSCSQHQDGRKADMTTEDVPYTVCLSAMSETSLKRGTEDLCDHAAVPGLFRMKDLSLTSCLRRDVYPYRLAVVAASAEELIKNLHNTADQPREAVKPKVSPRIVFVFAGMGTGWSGMGREMMACYPVFKEVIQTIDVSLRRFVDWSLLDRLVKGDDPMDAIYGPIAVFACQVALVELWKHWGIHHDVIVGQSVGEVAAACAAGILTLDDAVKVIFHRTCVLSEVRGGKMLVVGNMPVERVEDLCRHYTGRANISLYYNPYACSISGDAEVVDEMRAILEAMPEKKDDFFLRNLNVASAFHSHHMEPCKAKLLSRLADLRPGPGPVQDIVSSVTAERPLDGEFSCAEYWARNVREPSYFFQALMKCLDPSLPNICLEIGPKAVLRAHMHHITAANVIAVPSMQENLERRCILQTACKLFERGVQLRWDCINDLDGARVIDLPRYRFSRLKNLYIPPDRKERLSGAIHKLGDHRLLRRCGGQKTHFKAFVREDNFGSVYEHRFQGTALLPGAFYVELALGLLWQADLSPIYNTRVSAKFTEPCKLQRGQGVELDVVVTEIQRDTGRSSHNFAVLQAGKTHATGFIEEVPPCCDRLRWDVEAIRQRCQKVFTREEKYDVLERMGFTYGEMLRVSGDSVYSDKESLMELRINDSLKEEMRGTALHPAVLDGIFQVPIPMFANETRAFLPVSVGGVVLRRPLHEGKIGYGFCSRSTAAVDFYTIYLLTETGETVLEIHDFAIQFLDEETIDRLLYLSTWRLLDVSPEKPQPGDVEDFWSKNLVLTDVLPTNHPALCLQLARDQADDFTAEVQSKLAGDLASVILFVQSGLNEDADADAVHEEVLTFYQALRIVLTSLLQQHKSLPVILITRGVWQVPEMSKRTVQSSLSGATLWGLVRSLLLEAYYKDIKMVDIHTPRSGNVKELLPSLFSLIRQKQLRELPEFLVCDDRVYCNEITRADVLDTPAFKNQKTDFPCRVQLFCDGTLTPDHLFFKHVENRRSETRDVPQNGDSLVELRTSSAAILDFNRNRDYEGRALSKSDKLLLCIEVTGSETEGSEPLLSCYPVPAATWVRVPRRCTLPLKDFPHYQPGMLSRIFLLQRLCEFVTSNSVAVLSDQATLSYAQLMEDLLRSRHTKNVEIVLLDSLPSCRGLKVPAMISLVHLSTEEAAILARVWTSPQTLCCPEELASSSAISVLSAGAPQLNVHLPTLSGPMVPARFLKEADAAMQWVKDHRESVERASKTWAELTLSEASRRDVMVAPRNMSDLMESLSVPLSPEKMAKIPVRAEQAELYRKDAAYVVVGALSGLGWEITSFLASKGAGHIVLMGRREPTADQKDKLHHLEREHACKTLCAQADVCKMESLKAAMDRISEAFPGTPLKGVFFGAAVLDDGVFEMMTLERFQNVTKPKIVGAWNFHLLTRNLPLDFFVLHSSVTSVFGNLGQTNYGAGNAFMDALAAHRRSLGLCGLTINWGPLSLGMTDGLGAAAANLARQGYSYLDRDEILSCFELALMKSDPQVIATKMDRETFTAYAVKKNFRSLLTRIGPIVSKAAAARETTSKSTAASTHFDVSAALKLSPPEFHARLQTYTMTVTSRVFGVDEASLTLDTSLLDFGVDSMLAMAMINQIHQDTGIRLSVVILLNQDSSVRSVVTELERAIISSVGKKTAEVKTEESSAHSLYDFSYFHNKLFVNIVVTFIRYKNQDPEKFVNVVRRAGLAVVGAHPLLCTTFVKEPSETNGSLKFRQKVITPEDALDFRVVIDDSTPAGQEEMEIKMSESLSPEKGPVRLVVVKSPSLKFGLVLDLAMFDLTSVELFLECFGSAVRALEAGDNHPKVHFDSTSLSKEIDAVLATQSARLERFWQGIVAKPVKAVSVASRQRKPGEKNERQEVHGGVLPKDLRISLLRFCSEVGLLPVKLLICCYQLLLALITGERTVPIALGTSSRVHVPGAARALGRGTNHVPVLAEIHPDSSILDFLKSTAGTMDEALDHSLYPAPLIRKLAGEQSRGLFLHTVIVDEMQPFREYEKKARERGAEVVVSPITHHGSLEGETLLEIFLGEEFTELILAYNSAVLTERRAQAMQKALPLLIEDLLLASPNERLGSFFQQPSLKQLRQACLE